MNIYLIRHAEAEPTSELKPHEDRELTPRGISILKASTDVWKNYIANFDIILSSPLKRAMQTAEIIRGVFDVKIGIMKDISLLNGGETEDLLSVAQSLVLNEIAMIGHQPDIGNHISAMIGTHEFISRITPATIAKISFIDNPGMRNGNLEFLIPHANKKG